jgi:hypothetical protein
VFVLSCCGDKHSVFALVGIAQQMAYVSDVLDIGNIIAEILQVSHETIEADVAFGVSEMGVAVNSRAADIDSDFAFF